MHRYLPLLLLGLTACPGIGSTDTSVLQEVPERPTYKEIAQITASYCLRCHNQANAQGDFDGDTYDTLYAQREDAKGVIDAGLMQPLSEPPMAAVDRETFLKWVDIGAPPADTAD
jgi:hypothetical protein